VVAYRKPAESTVHRLINKLKQHYNLEGGNDLRWFLGIRILRDREKRIIWLSQSSYVDKIINLAKSTQPDDTPMSREELIPYEDRASYSEVNLY
jgi:hypothetical protein